MQKVSILFLLILFISCNNEDDAVVNIPVTPVFTITINATYCPTIHCNEESGIADLALQFFTKLEDAQSGLNFITSGSTDESGMYTAEVSTDQAIFVRAEHPEKGVYISQVPQGANDSSASIEINYIGNFVYDHSDELTLAQSHISWLHPAVGQISHYRYHFTQPVDYFDYLKLPISYSNAKMQVSIVDQLTENSFIIEEQIDTLDPWLNIWYVNKHSNIWTFEENRILISENNENVDKVFSFILGEHASSWTHPFGSEFEIDLTPCIPVEIDLNEDDFHGIDWSNCPLIKNYELFEQSYHDLSISFHSLAFVDGDDRIKVYSLEDGLVRYIGINQMAHFVYGFDQVLAD